MGARRICQRVVDGWGARAATVGCNLESNEQSTGSASAEGHENVRYSWNIALLGTSQSPGSKSNQDRIHELSTYPAVYTYLPLDPKITHQSAVVAREVGWVTDVGIIHDDYF